MSILDQQIKHNDCGISAIKTIFNYYGVEIEREYIQNQVFIDQKGSRLSDLKDFFDNNGFESEYKLLDINYIGDNVDYFKNLCPFIIPVLDRSEQHYLIVTGIKKNKLTVLDPAKTRPHQISLSELKNKSYINETLIDLADSEEKLHALINKELTPYAIDKAALYRTQNLGEVFNKVTFFSFYKENYGFSSDAKEFQFLNDLLFNFTVNSLPKEYQTTTVEDRYLKLKTPVILLAKPQKASVPKPAEDPLTTEPRKNVFLKLLGQLGENKKLWYIYIFAALFSASITQLTVFINQILIDHVLPSYQINVLVLFAVGVTVFKIFELIITQYKNFVSIHLGNILDKFFLGTFDQKLNDYSIQYIQTFNRGDLSERLSDTMKLKSFFLRYFTRILVDIVVSLYSIGLLFLISWQLTIIVCMVMVLFYLWFAVITPYLQENERQRFTVKAAFFSQMIEKIDGLQVIKSFGIEHSFSRKMVDKINNLIHIQTKVRYINLVNISVVGLIVLFASLTILIILAKDNMNTQNISVGQIITYIALSGRIFSSLSSLLSENLALQEHLIILKRYFDFNQATNNDLNNEGIRDFEIEQLSFKELSFSYHPKDTILSNVSFDLKKGQKIKIEGENGSGKSTLCKVITMLYPTDKGTIEINDAKLTFYDIRSVRAKILLSTNEDVLFNDSLHYNITLGREVRLEVIIGLAKRIGLYEFIASQAEGIYFVVSENGKNLSTGQRKKILLLRALISEAEILIIDEVLSGMDKQSREQVEKLLNDSDKTIIVISHEEITYINFDAKYLISNGQLTNV
ncbi:MAG: ABC transporter transmembrane domain-containing protein [Cyclobacteriaceae bacterium]